jgi:hypothetical protein
MHMKPIFAAAVLLSVLGCNRAALPLGDAAAPADLSVSDARLVDLAGLDLTDPCALTAPNSMVVLDGRSLGYAWLGNVDRGGEGNCGGSPEGVEVVFAPDGRLGEEAYKLTAFGLTLPAMVGSQTVTVRTMINGTRQSFGTVTVTAFTLRNGGPGLLTVEGDVDAPGLAMSGHFVAVHCPSLDIICI